VLHCPNLPAKDSKQRINTRKPWETLPGHGQNRKAILATQTPVMSDAIAKGQILLVLRGREKEGSRHSLTSGNNLVAQDPSQVMCIDLS